MLVELPGLSFLRIVMNEHGVPRSLCPSSMLVIVCDPKNILKSRGRARATPSSPACAGKSPHLIFASLHWSGCASTRLQQSLLFGVCTLATSRQAKKKQHPNHVSQFLSSACAHLEVQGHCDGITDIFEIKCLRVSPREVHVQPSCQT